jgi:hypothetical protein
MFTFYLYDVANQIHGLGNQQPELLLPAQRPDVILPLFTRVSVLPIKFTPVGTSTVPEIQRQQRTKKGMISHPLRLVVFNSS